jgi:hypothetical protein
MQGRVRTTSSPSPRGTSEWTAAMLAEAKDHAHRLGLGISTVCVCIHVLY